MKRTTMKNAPNLPKLTGQGTDTATATTTQHHATHATAASPVVGDLRARLQGMKGNTITLPVCGRDVSFTLETVVPEMVEKATMVWGGNERDQELLTQSALDDLIPSFLSSGQQNPAFGRKVTGIIEVADGSRRRAAAIFTNSEYRVLVGELDEEQMAWLSQIGNDYRPTSAFERGKRYARRLVGEFGGNVSKLAEAEGISRKIIMRCIKTAELPREIIGLFSNPTELSARAGEALAKAYAAQPDAVFALAQHLLRRKKGGETFETDDVLNQLHSVAEKTDKPVARERVFGNGIKAKYKGDAVSFQLNNVPQTLIQKIEELLELHQAEQQKAVSEAVNSSFVEIDEVVKTIRTAAAGIRYEIPANEIQSLIPFARNTIRESENQAAAIERIASEITRRYVIE